MKHVEFEIPEASQIREEAYKNNQEIHVASINEIVKRIQQAKTYGNPTVPLGNVHVDDFIREKFREKGYVFDYDIHPTTGIRNREVINLVKSK